MLVAYVIKPLNGALFSQGSHCLGMRKNMKFLLATVFLGGLLSGLLGSAMCFANELQQEPAKIESSQGSHWSDHSYFDNTYLELHSGSLLGLAHVSAGKIFADNHHLKTGFGYVPKMDDHAELTLWTLGYRYQHPFQFELAGKSVKPFSLGIAFMRGEHRKLFAKLPDQYPSGYYAPTAFRIIFNYQANVQITPQWEAYLDFSVIDMGFASYIREPEFFLDNYDYLGLEGITNWGFGARYKF